MLATWVAIKKSLRCEPSASEVYDPQISGKSSRIRKCRSGYSYKAISHLKGVLDGGKRHKINLTSQSPLSVRSSELRNPITHQARFSNTTAELEISRNSSRSSFARSQQAGSSGSRIPSCQKCGETLKRREDADAHNLSKHVVTELVEGDPSRNVIERILQTGRSSPKTSMRVARILKVHNLQTTLAQFEEYRETVIIRAHHLPKKHPRCLADGNELLRFYGTTFTCSLGDNNSPTLCRSDVCSVCCILRHGFKPKNASGDLLSVFTASTAEEANEYIQVDQMDQHLNKALILCRVIAGRVQKPVDQSLDTVTRSGFDSVAGNYGHDNSIEKLYSLDPSALLPCFVIVCKP